MIGPDYDEMIYEKTRSGSFSNLLLFFLWYSFVAFVTVLAVAFWIEVGRRIISLF